MLEIGSVFGEWTIIGPRVGNKGNLRRYPCECKCGTHKEVSEYNLLDGRSKSCGCAAFKGRSPGLERPAGTYPEYSNWQQINRRCNHETSENYSNYGGRGISVCERWSIFSNFLQDMGPKPSSNHSVERKDVDGNYEPNNCRWATVEEQNRNQRRNVFLTANGKTQLLTDWAKELGVSHTALINRMKRGLSQEEVINTPFREYKRS